MREEWSDAELVGGEEVPRNVEDAHVFGATERGEGAPGQVEAVVVVACARTAESTLVQSDLGEIVLTGRAGIGNEGLDARACVGPGDLDVATAELAVRIGPAAAAAASSESALR